MNAKKRILVFFIFMGLFSLAFQIGAMSEVSEEDALEFMKEFEELIEDIDGVGIFLHNNTISLPMFIPGFGIAWGFYSALSTGYAFAAIVLIAPAALSNIPPLALLYASPFGFMELVAYSIATSRSFILIHIIIKKINLRTAIRGTAIEVGIVVGLLLAGGILEFYMIELAKSGVDFGVF
ncbi:MAG: conserved membrane protein of unknown function [Nitrosopumilales archaeon]|nr:MAG: conserved membrane protein of unknown function [Nitrosopumilales archaeon]